MKTMVMMLGAGLIVAATSGWTQEAPKNTMKNTLSLGLTWTEGNSKNVSGNASLVSSGERERLGSYRLALEGAYGESRVDNDTRKNIEMARGSANLKKTFTPRTFGYFDSSALYDGIAEIDYRVTLSPGFGTYFVKNERTALSVEIGPGYIYEKTGGERDEYPVFRAAQRLEQKLSATAQFWQSLEYLPEASEFGNYLLSGEAGIEAAINSRFNLRLSAQDKYDSRPPEGIKKNDFILTAGLSINL